MSNLSLWRMKRWYNYWVEDDFLKVAKKAALEAGEGIQKYSGQIYQKNTKHDDVSDVVTDADLKAEEIIVRILTKNFPDHSIFAEENGKKDKGSKYTWVIDPIDGTISFTHGVPYYSVSIGLLEKNVPVLGVTYNVSFNQLYWAVKGKGAYFNGEKIHVSNINALEEAACSMDFGHRKRRQDKIERYINPLINKVGYPYSFGSGVATLGFVASGILEAYVCQAWLWDFVAGTVIVREAGGLVTDFEGQEPDWTKERLNIVASNGLVHNQIIEALR